MEKKELADAFLSINQLNRQKLNILLKMMALDNKDMINSSEYLEYTEIYELIYSIQSKNLSKITEDEKEDIKNTIIDLNPNALSKTELEDIFKSNNDFLILRRTLMDLNIPLLMLYHSKPTPPVFLDSLYKLMGLSALMEDSIPQINNELVNQYMVSDFTNVFYTIIQNKIDSDTVNQEEKERLLNWKYKLIFLSSDIETRALMTKFDVPNYPNLVSDIIVETTGMPMQDYIDNLDDIVFDLLNSIITKILNRNLNKELDLFDLVLLKTLTLLLSNKELCRGFKLSYKQETSHSLKITVDIINKILKEAQESKVDYQKQRKFPTI